MQRKDYYSFFTKEKLFKKFRSDKNNYGKILKQKCGISLFYLKYLYS